MHTRFPFGLPVAFSIFVMGCAGEQSAPATPAQTSKHSFPEAMNMLCNVDKLASLSPEEELLEIGQKRSTWLSDQVDNPDFIEFRTLVSVKGPEEQAQRIRAKAKEVGIEKCPVADSIEASSMGGLLP